MHETLTLRSIEHRSYDAEHVCAVVEVLDGSSPGKVLVSVDPPIPAWVYGGVNGDLDRLVLAPRFEGSSLLPELSEQPLHVHMCIPQDEEGWKTGPYRVVDWGVVESP